MSGDLSKVHPALLQAPPGATAAPTSAELARYQRFTEAALTGYLASFAGINTHLTPAQIAVEVMDFVDATAAEFDRRAPR